MAGSEKEHKGGNLASSTRMKTILKLIETGGVPPHTEDKR